MKNFRSSHPEVFLGKGVLKIYSKFIRIPMPKCDLIKLLCNFIEITPWHGCSPVKLLHILRTPFLRNTSKELLLKLKSSFRSSHQRCSVKKSVLRNFEKSTGKHLCQSLFLVKLQARSATLLKKRLWHRCFPVNFAKFLRTPFLRNTSGRLLLQFQIKQYNKSKMRC